jgi:hypothetical protein
MNEDPEIWITNLEDLRLKLEVMGSNMADEQFPIQVLYSLTGDYKLQMTANDGIDKNIWSGDSGASCHYCNSEEGVYNYTTISEEITVRNGNKMLAKKVGSLRCTVQPKNGDKFVVVLQNVKFVPDLWVNLFRISKAVKNGFNLGNEDVVMKLMKGNMILYLTEF